MPNCWIWKEPYVALCINKRTNANQLPAYAEEFRIVRRNKGLPVSRVLGPSPSDSLRRVQTTTASSPESYNRAAMQRANTSTASGLQSNPRRVSAAASVPVHRTAQTFTRPAEEDGEEAPPPYARMDPEPDSTRLLQDRLAAEALQPPVDREAPPQAPPPATPPPNETATTESNTAHAPPERVPSDPELRRIWEESQFEEAARLSRVAERERLELEEVMNLSLVEAETRAEAGGSGVYNGASGTNGFGASASSSAPAETSRTSTPRSGGHQTPQDGGTEDFMTPSYESHHYDTLHPGNTASAQRNLEAEHKADVLAATRTGTVMQSRNPFLSPAEHQRQDSNDEPLLSFDEPEVPDHSAQTSNTPSGYSLPQTPQQRQSFSHLSTPTQSLLPQSAHGSPSGSSGSVQPQGQSPRQSKPLPSPPGRPLPQLSSQTPSSGTGNQEGFAPPMGPPPSHFRLPTSSDASGTPTRQMFSPTTGQPQPPLPPRPSGLPASLYPGAAEPTQQNQSGQQGASVPQQQQQQQQQQQRQQNSSSTRTSLDLPQHSFDLASAPPPLPSRRDTRTETTQDPLDVLKQYDTVFLSTSLRLSVFPALPRLCRHTLMLVNDSATMAGDKWDQVMNVIVGVAETAAKYDEDGVDVYFLNSKRVGKELKVR